MADQRDYFRLMVLTMLEGHVAPEREQDLLAAYRETATGQLPPFVLGSYLVRDPVNRAEWRIFTVFRSREELDAMRATGNTPRAVQIFQAAGTTPTFAFFEIADHFHNTTPT